ncbi:cyclin-like protein interacting with PHO85 [Dipsacomyces acuminosporus]|nr:cyclin-like protein interacting with PHO85 [Dipsacomyces acuminosporus]
MFDVERTPTSETISRMAELIDSVISTNHLTIGPNVNDITPFHSRAIPGISVHDYLQRVAKFVCLENDTLIAILVYLDRISKAQSHRPSLAPSPYNIHRLIITAIVVAHKFNSDIFFNNARYSKVGGVPLAEMNQLELELLFLVRFDLKIDAEELQRIGNWLLTKPRVQVGRRHMPIGMLSLYYDQLALAQQAEKVIAAQPRVIQYAHPTPGMHPSTNQNGSAASCPQLELVPCAVSQPPKDIPHPHHPRHRHHHSYPYPQPHQQQQQHHHHHHHQQQQQSTNTSNGAELTTPSSLNTPYPSGSPECSGCATCELDNSAGSIPALETVRRNGGPMVNMQPNLHSDHNFTTTDANWKESNSIVAGAFSPISPNDNMFAGSTAVNQKRRRIQPIGVIPVATAASANSSVPMQNIIPTVVNATNSGESD